MTTNEDAFSDSYSEDLFAPTEGSENMALQPDNPEHPVRQMIRRVRAAQRQGKDLDEYHPVDLRASTWNHELDTPGSTELGKLQSFASSLAKYSQLDADLVVTELPDQLGRFSIKKILGAGGFGWVLLADDPQLNRPVALKVPRLDTLISNTGRARFLREARAAALLAHPNLVTVYEAGQIGPILYIAFEWIDGKPLSEWLVEHRSELDFRSTAKLMSTLAQAVHHAHQRGIVHRDLKPSNILIKNADSPPLEAAQIAERAKIADFGLAHLGESSGELTRSGALMGTPKYLAPEQIESTGAQSEPRIDVYGLGAVMYELLTGQAPFNGPTLAAIIRAVEQDPPAVPRKLNSSVPKDLEAICLKCLEKNPALRYGSAALLAADLEGFFEGAPVRARRPNFLERTGRWIQRNRLVTFAFSLALLSLTVGLVIAANQAQRANASLLESQQQRRRAERHRDRAESAIDTLLSQVADSLESIPQMQPVRRSLLEQALAHEQAALEDEGDDPASQLRVADSLGRIADLLYRLGLYDESIKTCDELQQLLSGFEPDKSDQRFRSEVALLKSQLIESRILLRQAAHAKATEQLQVTLGLTATSQTPEFVRLRAMALHLSGISLRDQGDLEAAEHSFLEASTTLQSIPSSNRTAGDERDLISNMSMIGGLRYSLGKYAEAIQIWEQVAAVEATIDPRVPQQNILLGNRAAGLANLAMAHAFNRDFTTSLEYYQRSNEQYRDLCIQFPLHFEHASGRLSALIGRSVTLQNAGQVQAAIESYQEAVDWGEQLVQRFGEQPRLVVEMSRALGNLGNVLQFKGRQEDAMNAWNRGLNYVRKNLERQPENGAYLGDLTFALSNLANFHLQKNQLEQAGTIIAEALSSSQKALESFPRDQKIINAARNLHANGALLFCFRHNHDQALQEIERIVELQPTQPETIVFAAKTAARLQISVGGNLHELFGRDDDQEIAARYANRALELLTSARELGFEDFAGLRQQPEFSQIVTLPEFGEIERE
jgi:serine/threonine protein kinase